MKVLSVQAAAASQLAARLQQQPAASVSTTLRHCAPCRANRRLRVQAQAANETGARGIRVAPGLVAALRAHPSPRLPRPPWLAEAVVDENIGEYCSLDGTGKRPTKEMSLEEKEQMFLEAMTVGRAARRRRLRAAVLATADTALQFSSALAGPSAAAHPCTAGWQQARGRGRPADIPTALCSAGGAGRAERCLPQAPSPFAYFAVPLFCLPSSSCSSLQAYYYESSPTLSNEEFDNLKSELVWEGSKVVVLRCAAGWVPVGGCWWAPIWV